MDLIKTGSTQYTFVSCIESCITYNNNIFLGNSTLCQAITYLSDLTYSHSEFGGNCFLKNHIGINKPDGHGAMSAGIVPGDTQDHR